MLCLTRRTAESIIIRVPGCDPIVVKVLSSHEGRAIIGIEAPANVRADREEIDTRRTGRKPGTVPSPMKRRI